MEYVFIALGIIIGIIIQKYVFAYFDVKFQVFSIRESAKIVSHQVNMEKTELDFLREYPEANANYKELSPAIGFHYEPPIDKENYYDDKKMRMGF